MKKYFFTLGLLVLTACSTAPMNVAKLKEDDRIYGGKVLVQINDQDNKTAVCDVFLNIDLNPIYRVSQNGFYDFKTIRKNLNYGKIVCLHKINGEQQWISHGFDLKKIKHSDDNTTITSLGTMVITWKISEDALQKPATRFANDINDNFDDIGKFKVEFKPDLTEVTQYLQDKYSDLKDPKYKFVEKIFEENKDD